MTGASRFANEYGDLTHLPLFSQTANGVTPVTPGLDPTVTSPPAATSDVDWALVSTLRAQASEQLSQAVQSDRARLDKEAQQELGRSIVLDLIESAMGEAVDAGHGSWRPAKQQATAQAVFDSLFRLGRSSHWSTTTGSRTSSSSVTTTCSSSWSTGRSCPDRRSPTPIRS